MAFIPADIKQEARRLAAQHGIQHAADTLSINPRLIAIWIRDGYSEAELKASLEARTPRQPGPLYTGRELMARLRDQPPGDQPRKGWWI